jgi:hypothetical protein
VVRSRGLLRSFQLVATRPLNRISKHCGVGEEQSIALKKPNFRIARHPPKIVTCAELDFYDLPLIRPSGFVNSAALALFESRTARRWQEV